MIVIARYEPLHDWVRAYLIERRKENPEYAILDVGGVAMPWANEFAPDYLDIQAHATFAGDAGLQSTWDKLGGRVYDFSICTQTLEDLRDPGFVIDKLIKHSRGGFIGVPHKHTELGWMVRLENQYVGYCHHRWVFALQNERLRYMAKWPVTSQFRPGAKPGPEGLPWLNPSLFNHSELGFVWSGSFEHEYIRQDFAGLAHEGCEGMLAMYATELAEGL